MKTIRQPLILTAALSAALALGACGKNNQPASTAPAVPPPSATTMAPPMTTPPITPMPSSTSAMAPTGSSAAVTFSSLELGSNVGANNKISSTASSFAPKDNIHASVETMGSGHATVSVKWTYQDGQTVHEDSKSLDATGASENTDFMISKPGGFPTGNYKVEISLDGKPVASKDFSVRK
ncbi:MAG: hypothetical protein ABI386_00790 [Rhodanobacter sp.]